jgi:transcriptional regulator with XRE-family HTH domain
VPTKSPTLSADALRKYVNREARINGIRVKARRKALELTLEQAAELAFTTPQTIFKIEEGQIVARDHVRLAIAFALGCEVNDLFPAPKRADVLREVA